MGVAMPSFIQGNIIANGATPAAGLYTDTVVFGPSVTTIGNAGSVTAAFTIYAADGVTVVASGSKSGRAGDTLAPGPITVSAPVQLWSVARPYLLTLVVELSVGGSVVDAVNETVAVRNVAWDGEKGLVLNEQNVKMRGACNHESFTGVGAGECLDAGCCVSLSRGRETVLKDVVRPHEKMWCGRMRRCGATVWSAPPS